MTEAIRLLQNIDACTTGLVVAPTHFQQRVAADGLARNLFDLLGKEMTSELIDRLCELV